MKIALVSTHLESVPQAFQGSREREEPLDLMYTASWGRFQGDVDTFLCDVTTVAGKNQLLDADAVILSTTNSYLQWNNHPMGLGLVLKSMKAVREQVGPDLPVVVFGPHVPAFSQELYELGANAVLLGEAEMVALDVAKDLIVTGRTTQATVGLVPRGGGHTSPVVVADLNSLPVPAYDQTGPLNFNAHNHPGDKSHGHLYEASRGCYYQCSFCNTITHRRAYRTKSPTKVLADLKFLMQHSEKDYVYFIDESFGAAKGWTEEILDVLASLPLSYGCQGNLSFLNDDKLQRMAAAGFTNVEFGYETANAGIIKSIGKNNRLTKAAGLLNAACQLGMSPLLFTQVGLPGESEWTLRENISFLRTLDRRVRISIAMTTPYRETELWREGVRAGLIPEQARGDDLYAFTGRVGHDLQFDSGEATRFLSKYGPNNYLGDGFLDGLEMDLMSLFGLRNV